MVGVDLSVALPANPAVVSTELRREVPVIDIVISRAELFTIREYSCSIPTGTVIGKRWRRDVHAFRRRATPVDRHEWQIGEYIEHSDPGKVGIKWGWAVDDQHEPHRGKQP